MSGVGVWFDRLTTNGTDRLTANETDKPITD
jgi:hypothetical protein